MRFGRVKLETRVREGDQAGLYPHLKMINMGGKRDRSSAHIKYDEDRIFPRGVELIRERWVRWFYALLNAKSPKLDPNFAEGPQVTSVSRTYAGNSAHDAGADRQHPLVGKPKICWTGRSLR